MMGIMVMSTTRGGLSSHFEEGLSCDNVDDNDNIGLPSKNDDQ